MSDLPQGEPTWTEVCPHFGGPHCNPACAARLRAAWASYDRSIPDVDVFCPVHAQLRCDEPEPPRDRYEVMHSEPDQGSHISSDPDQS